MVASLICSTSPVLAQYTQQGGKLTASGALGTPALGTSVAVSADGTTAIVGGPNDNNGAGAAWVFTRVNSQWAQQSKLLGSEVAKGIAGQGASVALSADGNTAVIGGPNDNGGTGAMWVFTRANGVWTQQAKLWGSVLQGLAHQGLSVAVSADGNTAMVGGDLYDGFNGAAWVFRRVNGVWNIIPVTLVGSGSTPMSHQGAAVALSADGNTALIGGPGDNNGAGSAWVFTFSNGTWTQQGSKLTGFNATAEAAFGSSVALSADGNTALVGGPGDSNDVGAVWVFTRSNGQWTQQGPKILGSDLAPTRLLGKSVALTGDGNTALAGGPGGSTNIFLRSPAIGATWVFTRTSGVWNQQGPRLVGSGTVTNDALQGTSVSVSADGTRALVGGPTDNGGAGAVWAFERPPALPLPTPPAITVQPGSQTIPFGQAATLTVMATGTAPLTYQWYVGTRGTTTAPVGMNASSFTTPALTATVSYWVRVTNPYGTADSNTATVTVAPRSPLVTQVTNGASRTPTIAPNTWVEIKGENLAPAARIWQSSDFVNNRMPVQLDGVSVTVNGRSAFVYYISPTQVNVLAPPDDMPGAVEVQVTNGLLASAPFAVRAQPISPSFFVFDGGPHVAATHANGSYLGPSTLYPGVTTPARPGEVVVMYGNGFGPTSAPITSGSPVQSGVLAAMPVIQIGGITSTVQFAGLVAPGEFQFNVVVPSDVPNGNNTLVALYNGIPTQPGVVMQVER
jgi:uncharacterized protein (TIGR03437 family)